MPTREQRNRDQQRLDHRRRVLANQFQTKESIVPLVPFPTEFPVEALPVLAGYLRKQKSTSDAANAAWNVVGWGGGSFLPSNPQPQLATGAQIESDDAIAQKFDDAYQQVKSAGDPAAQKALFGGGAFLKLIGPLLIQVATKLIGQWLGGGTVTQ